MSALDQRLAEIRTTQQELRDMQSRLHDSRLSGGGAGGGGGNVEKRVERLESQFDKLREDNSAIRERLATLTERVAHLPSKEFIVRALVVSLGVITALVTFGEKLQALVR